MAEKDGPKSPHPQNSGPRERPTMPENRVVKGNDPKPGSITAIRIPNIKKF